MNTIAQVVRAKKPLPRHRVTQMDTTPLHSGKLWDAAQDIPARGALTQLSSSVQYSNPTGYPGELNTEISF